MFSHPSDLICTVRGTAEHTCLLGTALYKGSPKGPTTIVKTLHRLVRDVPGRCLAVWNMTINVAICNALN